MHHLARPDRRRLAARRRPVSAYTLIELLIVIAILGIAGALVVPRLVARDALKLQAAVRLIVSDLSFAQSDALAHQEYRRVQFFDDGGGWGGGYAIVRVTESNFNDAWDEDAADYIDDPLRSGGDARYVVDFEADDRFNGVRVWSWIDDGNRYVTYDALGGTVSDVGVPGISGFVIVEHGTMRYTISVAPFTGKLTVTKVS